MTDAGSAALRQFLVERYDDLRSRLVRRLGSEDEACDTLHEVYMRLHRTQSMGTVQSPMAYLVRMAINIITDRRRSEKRHNRVDIETVLELMDSAPGQDRILEGKAAFAVLLDAMQELTPRQRRILVAAKLDQVPRTEIARQLNISRRLVHDELSKALAICQRYVEEK